MKRYPHLVNHTASPATVATPTYAPTTRYLTRTQGVMRGSAARRGGRRITSPSDGLKPRAVAGRPSVARLTQRSLFIKKEIRTNNVV